MRQQEAGRRSAGPSTRPKPHGAGNQQALLVLTTRSDEPKELYEFYACRGEAENWIKDFKVHTKADRLSCHRFVANQFSGCCCTERPTGLWMP
jgi:hypothetical protein